MAWSFVGVSSVVEVSTTAHALVTTGITGLAQGDLMIACISSRIASTTSVTLPVGWTLVAEQKNNNIATNNSAAASGLMAYHVRGASNPALTFTHPVAPAPAIGRIVAYRGVNATTPKDTQVAAQTGNNTTAVSVAGLTTAQLDELVVAMAAGGQEAAWSAFNATDPSGASGATSTAAPTTAWLERADSATTTGNDTSLAIFDALKSATGATGNFTATASVAAVQVIIAGAFRGPTAYRLTADNTPITLTGSATGLLRTVVMPAAASAITLTGNAAGMARGFTMPVTAGAVAVTGNAATLTKTTAARLTAEVGAISVSTVPAILRRTRVMPAVKASIVVSGIDATLKLRRVYTMIAAPGGIVVTGYAASLSTLSGKTMLAAKGEIALSGQAATLRATRALPATVSSIIVTGNDADLDHFVINHYTLDAAKGGVVVSGSWADLQHGNRQPGPLHFGYRAWLNPW